MNERIERDSLGEVQVPADKYWGRRRSEAGKTFASAKKQCRLNSFMPMPS